jgi:parvulin-like peptidyl-prolyl isomerase
MTLILPLVFASLVAGCSSGGRPVPREQLDGRPIMTPPRGRLPTEPYSVVDQPGAVPYDSSTPVIRGPRTGEGRSPDDVALSPAATRALDRAVPPLAEPFDQSQSSASTTAPTSRAVSPGSFKTIGGVVAEVNSTAIYADKVISDIEPALAAQAPQLTQQQFMRFAADEIRQKVSERVNAELLYAAADRLLDDKDKRQAEIIAEIWRQQQVTDAGGSQELAKHRFENQGRNFEDQVHEEYRRQMVQGLLRKRIIPQTQVTAAEMRQFYEANRDKLFTVRDQAQFEMIQVDPAKVGGLDIAKQKIEEYRAWANDGRDFNELAKFSNRPRLRNAEGELSWIDRGAFALTALEDAVWKTQPGDVTPVVEEGGKFYIAKVEQKRLGRVKPFEDEQTQFDIEKTLREQKFKPRYDEMLQGLRRQSIVRAEPGMMQSALDIAMQRYPQWHAPQ